MKRILLFAALVMGFLAHAQTITIGEDMTISNQVPFYTLYTYSLTEQIFRADEIDYAGNIKSIQFRIGYSYNSAYTCDLDIYMKHVSKDQFYDPAAYEPVSPDDLVYSGPWTIPANLDYWIPLELDTPFPYNGTDNLLIAIKAKAEDFAIRFFRYSEASNAVFSCFSDSQDMDPSDLSNFSGIQEVISQRSNIKLVFGGNVGVMECGETSLNAYPIPAADLLYIDGADNESIRVYDATGRLVQEGTYTGPIHLDDLENGLYLAVTPKGVVRFVKNSDFR